MPTCLIIEDEYPAAARLQALLEKVGAGLSVLAVIESIADAVAWLQTHPHPDLILSDIQLSDGLSFGIYQQVPPRCPVIFTTAYDEYAIRAFQVHSVDYLLKPIKPEALTQALAKWRSLREALGAPTDPTPWQELLQHLRPTPSYKQRFLVSSREQLIPILAEEVAYFRTVHEIVYLMRRDGRQFATDFTLDQLMQQVDPQDFFRLNRQYLGHSQAIRQIHTYFNGRLKLDLHPDPAEEVIVSREKARAFKTWLGG